ARLRCKEQEERQKDANTLHAHTHVILLEIFSVRIRKRLWQCATLQHACLPVNFLVSWLGQFTRSPNISQPKPAVADCRFWGEELASAPRNSLTVRRADTPAKDRGKRLYRSNLANICQPGRIGRPRLCESKPQRR